MIAIWKTIVEVWKNRAELNGKTFDDDERAFLPSALALQSKPPAPLPRLIAFVVLAIFCTVVVWASVGKVNIVASAEGKIIPSGRVKVIQPLEKAIVREILVREGDHVNQGDPLIILDQTQTGASSERVHIELHDSRDRAFARRAVMAWLDTINVNTTTTRVDTLSFWQGFEKGPAQLATATVYLQWFVQRCAQYLAELGSLQQRFSEIKAEKEVSLQVIQKYKRTLPLVTEHAHSLDLMQSQKLVSRVQFLQIERERIQQEEELSTEYSRLEVFNTRMAEIEKQLAIHAAKTRSELLDELGSLAREIEGLEQESRKAEDLNKRQHLLAPVDGRVQQLMVSTVGGIVTPAQELMLIVPDNDRREVEVMLANKDIGFVYEGQAAEIKIHTFPFTKYGVIEAEVIHISDDAVADEQQGLIFPMKLRMQKSTIMVGNKQIELKPGMSVTAEVQTGKRRLIEFFLAPILKYRSESIRER